MTNAKSQMENGKWKLPKNFLPLFVIALKILLKTSDRARRSAPHDARRRPVESTWPQAPSIRFDGWRRGPRRVGGASTQGRESGRASVARAGIFLPRRMRACARLRRAGRV